MEADKVIPGNVMFSDDFNLKTTDGSKVTTVANFDETQHAHVGTGHIDGFTQISSNKTVMSFAYDHCVRMFDRETNEKQLYAGACNDEGFKDGYADARLAKPAAIAHDIKRPEMLILIEQRSYNASLRHISTTREENGVHYVSTLLKPNDDLRASSTFAQDKNSGDIYITSRNKIYKFVYASNTLVYFIGSEFYEHRDGPFSVASFKRPRGILFIENGKKLLVAGDYDHRLRILDLRISNVSSVGSGLAGHRDGNLFECTFNLPYSLLVIGDALYVGEYGGRIRKIIGEISRPQHATIGIIFYGIGNSQ